MGPNALSVSNPYFMSILNNDKNIPFVTRYHYKIGALEDTFYLGKYQVENEDPWPIEWEIVHQEDDYQIAMTKEIIDLRCFDGKEPNNTGNNRKNYGNNNWQYSNIEQFLNSDQASWYSSQHQYDAPPSSANCYHYPNGTTYNAYDTHKGFLYYFSDEEKSLLQDMVLTLANNTKTDGGGSYTWTGKVWLPTYTQMGYGNNNNIAEGIKFSKFTDNTSRIKSLHPNCIANNEYCKINNKSGNWYYWMSSVNQLYSNIARYINHDGLGSGSYPYGGSIGLTPCICLPKLALLNNTINNISSATKINRIMIKTTSTINDSKFFTLYKVSSNDKISVEPLYISMNGISSYDVNITLNAGETLRLEFVEDAEISEESVFNDSQFECDMLAFSTPIN